MSSEGRLESWNPESDKNANLAIAIIGASYAGLTLANVLQKYNEDYDANFGKIEFTLFEKMGPPGSIGCISGNLRLPSGEAVLKDIGLNGAWSDLKNSSKPILSSFPNVHTTLAKPSIGTNGNELSCNDDPFLVSQNACVETLRRNVETKIQHKKLLTRIFEKNTDRSVSHTNLHEYYLQMQCSDNNLAKRIKDKDRFVTVTIPTYEAVIKGPYHVIVGADGVLSKCRQYYRSKSFFRHSPVFLIGDARWVQNRWWDLGRLRIKSGADISICDGLELGKILVTQMKLNQNWTHQLTGHHCEDTDVDCFPFSHRALEELSKFTLCHQNDRLIKYFSSWAILIFIIATFLRD